MTEATPLASEQITQEDREAAAGMMHPTTDLARRILEGRGDGLRLVQAFARHRIAALSASPAPSGQGVSGEVPEGMKAWTGGDSAPVDWDGEAIFHPRFGVRWIGADHPLWHDALHYTPINPAVDHRTARGRANIAALQAADRAVEKIMAQSEIELVADAMKSMTANDVKALVRAWLDADDSTHWGAFEAALDAAISETPERALIVAMLRADAATMRANADAYSEEAPTDARALHEVAATLGFKAAQIERGDHLDETLAAPAPSCAPGEVEQGTVAFVQDWLMSSDHAPTQWDREFAAAIEGRAAGITDALVAQMVSRFLAWKLPADFNPDGGVSFKNVFGQHWPVGTNLFTAAQAEEMVRDMLVAALSPQGLDAKEGGK